MNKLNLLVFLKVVLLPITFLVFASCGDNDDDGIHSNHIVGKWHISPSSDKLIFYPDNTGLWIQSSGNKEFTWSVSESSNAIEVIQKFPGNKGSDWYLCFFKDECTENVLNGFYETYTYNEGYVDNKRNYNIKLRRHNNGCSYVDYSGPSDWDNYSNNSGSSGENGGSSNGNGGASGGNGGSSGIKAEVPEIGYYDSTPYTNRLTVKFEIYNQDQANVNQVKGYYGTSSANKSTSATLSGRMITLNITGLKKGTKYVVKVTATGPGGSSSESVTLSTLD